MDSTLLFIVIAVALLLIILLAAAAGSSKKKKVQSTAARNPKSSVWMPENMIEEKLLKYKENELSHGNFSHALIHSNGFLLTSEKDNTEPGQCDFVDGVRGTRLISVFTSLSEVKKRLRGGARHNQVTSVKVNPWFKKLGDDEGIVVNPTSRYTCEIQADDIKRIKLEMS